MSTAYLNFLNRVKETKSVKIFGTGKVAKTIYYLLRRKGVNVEAFIVSEKKEEEFCKLPVLQLDMIEKEKLKNIIVAFEKNEVVNEVVHKLLKLQAHNIIKVSQDVLNEIYCNFMIDEENMEEVCEQLKKEKDVIVYVNDYTGRLVTECFILKGIGISTICTDKTNLLTDYNMKFISFQDLELQNRESAIVLTIDNIWWQRSYLTRLRNLGFEKIIMIKPEILHQLRDEYRKVFWERENTGFEVIETPNVEKNHYVVQKKTGKYTYRWRVPERRCCPYSEEIWTSIKENQLLEEYEMQYPDCGFIPYSEVVWHEIEKPDCNLEVYMAKFHKDKQITEIKMPNWVIPIQVGKALTDIQVAQVCDNTGEHISEKNVDYSEGTALYWMWKNTKEQDYIGLFHYRRQMAMDENSLKKMLENDATFTLPTYMPEGIKTFFCSTFILTHDWEVMMHYIKEYDEAYYETALSYENKHFYFPCNIFIMKRPLFDDMCSFIFEVLDKVDEFYYSIHMERKDRYLGFLVENLLSIYIMHNAGKLKIGYTDMKYEYALNEN